MDRRLLLWQIDYFFSGKTGGRRRQLQYIHCIDVQGCLAVLLGEGISPKPHVGWLWRSHASFIRDIQFRTIQNSFVISYHDTQLILVLRWHCSLTLFFEILSYIISFENFSNHLWLTGVVPHVSYRFEPTRMIIVRRALVWAIFLTRS